MTEVVLGGGRSRREHLIERSEMSLLVRSGSRLVIVITLRRGSTSRTGRLFMGVINPTGECSQVIDSVDLGDVHVETTNIFRLNSPRRSCDCGDILMAIVGAPLHDTVSIGRSVAHKAVTRSWNFTGLFLDLSVPGSDTAVSKGKHVSERDIRISCENAHGGS
jgi:hypothetical protein